jgi:hypothetical protein
MKAIIKKQKMCKNSTTNTCYTVVAASRMFNVFSEDFAADELDITATHIEFKTPVTRLQGRQDSETGLVGLPRLAPKLGIGWDE